MSGYLWCHASFKDSVSQSHIGAPCNGGKRRNGHSLALIDDVSVLARVARLLAPCRPSAVCRFVIAVVVDAVNRMIRRRSMSHVGQECLERLAPSVAHANAASAVIAPFVGSGIHASFADTKPHVELGSAGVSVTGGGNRSGAWQALRGFAMQQVPSIDDAFAATRAANLKEIRLVFVDFWAAYGPFSKAVAYRELWQLPSASVSVSHRLTGIFSHLEPLCR